MRTDPYPSQELQVRLGNAKGRRNTAAYHHGETQRLVNGLQALVDRLRIADGGADALLAAKALWKTRSAEQDILSAKFAILDGDLMLKLEAAQGAVLAHHVASMAAGRGFGDPLALYLTPDEGPGAPGWFEAEAEAESARRGGGMT